jgi:hypothetical protein
LKNISQNFGKIALCGVVGSERKIKRVWDTSQQAKIARCRQTENGRFYGSGYPLPMLAEKLFFYQTMKGRERNGKGTKY